MTGFLPFYSESRNQTIAFCLTGNFLLDGAPVFDNMSNEVKDLIYNLLNSDPDERISLKTALCHPWFCENKHNSNIGKSPVKVLHKFIESEAMFETPKRTSTMSFLDSKDKHNLMESRSETNK